MRLRCYRGAISRRTPTSFGVVTSFRPRSAVTIISAFVVVVVVVIFVADKYPWSLPKVRPAIQIAVERINERSAGAALRLIVNYNDSQCSSTFAPLAAIEMYMRKSADVFIGPACHYALAPIARFSPYWNIPIITAGGLVKALSNKSTEYQLLTRTSSSYDYLGRFIFEMIGTFNWTTMIGVVVQSNLGSRATELGKSDYQFTIEGMYSLMQNYSWQRTSVAGASGSLIWYHPFDIKDSKMNFAALTSLISLNARSMFRTYILCFVKQSSLSHQVRYSMFC